MIRAAEPLFRVWQDIDRLRRSGTFERTLLEAWTDLEVSGRSSPELVDALFQATDPARLRAAGDPLPTTCPYTLYRGIAGHGAARRVRGYSWTGSAARAHWFATRFPHLGNPTVLKLTLASDDAILAYWNRRGEDEYIVRVTGDMPIRRVKPSSADTSKPAMMDD